VINLTTMPTAITAKSTMNGTKRKGGPVREAHVKHNKKPKIEPGVKSVVKKEKVKAKAAPVPKIEELSLDVSSDSDSDGGVPLEESEPTEDSDSEEIPTEGDGVHPERAKAVALSSKVSIPVHGALSNDKQVNLQRKHMQNKSNWQMSEKQQNLWPSH
jgi:pumilio family protein 6